MLTVQTVGLAGTSLTAARRTSASCDASGAGEELDQARVRTRRPVEKVDERVPGLRVEDERALIGQNLVGPLDGGGSHEPVQDAAVAASVGLSPTAGMPRSA